MNLKKYKPLLLLILSAGTAYLFHKTIFYGLKINTVDFHYSLEMLYTIFLFFSVSIGIVLLRVKEKSFDNVGMSFLFATSVKMIFCFLVLRPILKVTSQNNTIEKTNFLATFFLFLAIETVFTIRLVNEKQ